LNRFTATFRWGAKLPRHTILGFRRQNDKQELK
jgi:hypothetical protein